MSKILEESGFRTKTLTARVSPLTLSRIDTFANAMPYASRADALEYLFKLIDRQFGLVAFARIVHDYQRYSFLDGALLVQFIEDKRKCDTSQECDTIAGPCDTK